VETGERISNSTVFQAFEVGLLWNAKTAMGRIVQFPHHPQPGEKLRLLGRMSCPWFSTVFISKNRWIPQAVSGVNRSDSADIWASNQPL
jgi:hypothetical protein